jgi:hypothetical protein
LFLFGKIGEQQRRCAILFTAPCLDSGPAETTEISLAEKPLRPPPA